MRISRISIGRMRNTVVVCSLLLVTQGHGHVDDDEWIDPYDLLNYDATTKTMKKPLETSSYSNVPTKRREYIQDSSQMPVCPDITECNNKLDRLQKEIQEHKKVTSASQNPTCNPIFKRFLSKLLKEIEKLGLPNDANAHYDAEVKLSRQAVAEIRKLLNGEDSWRTGVLDDALSQILVNFKPHDYEAWKWHFEDTFGVELDTVMKVSVCVLIIVAIICSELLSTVSWFVQFRRMFAICFFISIVWNWFYLYKIAFAEHQTNIVKMESVNDKCTGVKKIDWKDNLMEWFRSTWTLQDDPCKKYYEVLMVNPILLVPPTKAISVTMTTFITEPLKHFGQGISEFLRALLKDLPVTLQIPVLLTIVLSILVFMYGSAQAVIQHGITRPLLGWRQDPPPPARLREADADPDADADPLARGDAHPRAPLPRRQIDQGGPAVRQRRNRPREERQKVFVETLRNADSPFSEDEADAAQRDGRSEVEAGEPPTGGAVEGEEKRKEQQQPVKNESGAKSNSQPKSNENVSRSGTLRTISKTARQKEEQTPMPTQGTDVQEVSSEGRASALTGGHVENFGTPVQETAH